MTIVQEVAQAIQLVTSKGKSSCFLSIYPQSFKTVFLIGLPFSIVCHSMGGLVSVQAVSYGLRTIAKFQAPEQILAFDTPWAGIKPEFKDLLASPDVASNLAILIGKAPSLVTAALTQQYVMTLAPKHEPAVSLGYQAAGWLAGQFVGRIVAESRATETFVDIVKPLVSLLMSGVQVRHYNFLEPVIIPAGAAEQMSQEMQYLISMNVRIELISCSRPVCFAAFEPPPGVNTSVWDQPLAQFPPWALVVFGGSLEGRDLGFSLMHVIHHIGMFDTEDLVQRACAKLV
jgi:hypothetical protein